LWRACGSDAVLSANQHASDSATFPLPPIRRGNSFRRGVYQWSHDQSRQTASDAAANISDVPTDAAARPERAAEEVAEAPPAEE
jgi:hypothetical protein